MTEGYKTDMMGSNASVERYSKGSAGEVET